MRRIAILLLVGAVVFAASGPAQGGRGHRQREVEAGYIVPRLSFWFIVAGATTPTYCDGVNGCQTFMPKRDERSLEMEAVDATGGEVYFYVFQDVDGDAFNDIPQSLAESCNRTRRPLPIEPGFSVYVYIRSGPYPPCNIATATTGTITATFSTKRATLW